MSSIKTLSSFTGMSEVELQRRAAELANTGKLTGLSQLEKALLAQTQGPKQTTADAFAAMGAGNAEPHVIEEPAAVMGRPQTTAAGFAPSTQAAGLQAPNSPAVLDAAAATGTDRMNGFFSVKQAQAKGKSPFELMNQMMTDIDLSGINGGGDAGSRELAFEQLKIQMQRISQGMQALSNTLSQSHETAKAAINNLRA